MGLGIVLVLVLFAAAEPVLSSPGTLEAARGVGKIALESTKGGVWRYARVFVGLRWLCGFKKSIQFDQPSQSKIPTVSQHYLYRELGRAG